MIKTIETRTLRELENTMNEFILYNEVFASQSYDPKWKGDTWKAILHYKEKKIKVLEPLTWIKKKSNEVMATEKQINYLKKLRFKGDFKVLTKSEAMRTIRRIKEEQETK